jgi:hypothetical protein
MPSGGIPMRLGRDELDRQVDRDFRPLSKTSVTGDFLPRVLRPLQAQQHQVIAAGREGDLAAGRDDHAVVAAAHAHDAAGHRGLVHLDLGGRGGLSTRLRVTGVLPALATVMKPTPFMPAWAGRLQGWLTVRAPIL